MGNNNHLLGVLFAFGATLFWSGNYIVARGVYESTPPVTLAFWRWTFALTAILPFSFKYFSNHYLKLIRRHFKYLCITALFGVTIFNTLVYIASHTTSALNLSLIAITCPAFILIISAIFLKKKLSVREITGSIVALSGLVVLITKGSLEQLMELDFSIGDIWMLVASIIFALYSIFLKDKPKSMDLGFFLFITFLLGLLFLVPFYIWEFNLEGAIPFTSDNILVFSYLGIFAALLSYFLWTRAILLIGPIKTSAIYYTLPVFSSIAAYLLLGENIEAVQLFSMFIVVTGILLCTIRT
ncbi:DMT family transporter [Fulvivirgaceae bacterium BMA10]|uniref:DMT family transporter n=1 Tax=Splendidivirga corallicola TaxID=3051826 RepID=A0ABT8KJ48_9BACT|nr:DMT family transporter [Fulvivirgaceae bacterium BMA10]